MIDNGQPPMDLVREAFHYQSRFKNATMVFKIDFPVTEDRSFSYFMKDLAMLAKMGVRIILVPGCKEFIDAILLEHKIVSSYCGKDRITNEASIPLVEMAAFNAATRLITALSASRVDAVIGNFVRSRGRGVVDGIDMEHTGAVDKIFSSAIKKILDFGMVPILPCIGWSPVGKPYNVSSDDIALESASALGAVKLFIVTKGYYLTGEHINIPQKIECSKNGRPIRLNQNEAEQIFELNYDDTSISNRDETGKEKSLNILNLALSALKHGVERVHIINGCEDGAVLRELYSNLGAGTMLYADEYESIRSIKNSDIPDILHIMEPLVLQGVLIRRTPEDIQKKKNDYVVFVIDGSVHGCAALHDWGEGQAEIAALAADKEYSDMGMGRRIVHFLIDKADKLGMHRVFVLTTKTQDWFELLGFREVDVESLPAQRRENYNKHRASKIFALDL